MFENESDVKPFFDLLNSMHPNISFTMESADPNLPFLDIDINVDTDGINTKVYRKNTNTGVVLNYSAMAPSMWKQGLIKCLLHRAKLICSSQLLFSNEIDKLRSMFLKNGYPLYFFEKTLKSFLERYNMNVSNNNLSDSVLNNASGDRKWSAVLKIPYIGEASYDFKSKIVPLFKEYLQCDILPVFTSCKVANYFSLKSPTPYPFKSNVVYKFACLRDADTSYIGETTRHLTTRVKEWTLQLQKISPVTKS